MQDVFLVIALSGGVQALRRGYELSYLFARSEEAAKLCLRTKEPLMTALRFAEIYGGNIVQLNTEAAMVDAVAKSESSLNNDTDFIAGLSRYIDDANVPAQQEPEQLASSFVPPEWSTQVPVTALKLSDAVKKLLISSGMQTAGDILAFDDSKKLETIVKPNAIKLIREAVAAAGEIFERNAKVVSEGDEVKVDGDAAKTDASEQATPSS